MNITRLLFVETGTYNDMALRPYNTHVTGDVVSAMQEATQGGHHIQPSNLAGVAESVMRPATQAQGMVDIAHGWAEPRLRFVMEITYPGFAGGEEVQYLTGYTDHVGVSALNGTAHLDPRMRLYINNSIRTRRVVEMTPLGRVARQTVSDASHVLFGQYSPGFGNMHAVTHVMRPEDVFKSIEGTPYRASGAEMFDTRTTFAEGIKKSRRSNGVATDYLSRVMTAHRNAVEGSDHSEDLSKIMGSAQGLVRESLVSQDAALQQFQRHADFSESNSITYGELQVLCPHLDHVTHVTRPGGVYQTAQTGQVHQRGLSEHWNGTNNETIMATILSQSVPGILMDLMLTKVGIHATNQTLDGSYHVQITDARGFAEGLDLTPYLQRFRERLTHEILIGLTQNNLIDIQIQGVFDLLGESNIQISVAGGPFVPFCAPSFADALWAPVLTNNAQTLQVLAHDINSLAENLSVDFSPANAPYPSLNHPEFNNGNSDTV